MRRTLAVLLTLTLALTLCAPALAAEPETAITYVVTDAEKGIRADMVSVDNPPSAMPGTALRDALCADRRYRFAGWYAEPEYRTRVREVPVGSAVTLYAKWEKTSFAITYELGGIELFYAGGRNPNRGWYDPGETYELAPVVFDNDAFAFGGWYRDAARTIPAGAIGPADAADLTIYALITEKVYPVYYVTASPDGGVDTDRVWHGNPAFRRASEALELSDAAVADSKYVFGGWYADPDYAEQLDEIPAYTTSAVTVWAKWNKVLQYQPVWGDATLSGGLTAADARAALRYSARLQDLEPMGRELADIDRSGKVTAGDARLILRMSALLESEDALAARYSWPDIVYRDGAWTLDEA